MQHFSIRDIENLSGIKAHTLRIWEQRYGLIIPERKESKHRQYSNEDLKQILKISYLYRRGHRISRIARMTPEQIDAASLNYTSGSDIEIFINQFLEAALDLDQDKFMLVFNQAISHLGFEDGIMHVVYPFLEKLGLLWMTGNFIPAQEHFSSQLIRQQIILDTDKIVPDPGVDRGPIVLFMPQGEHHEIPLLMINNILKKNGWRTIYFGADVSDETLAEYAIHYPGYPLYFHLLTNFTNLSADEYVLNLLHNFPARKIYASGPVTQEITIQDNNLLLIRTIDDVKKMEPIPGEKNQAGKT